MPCGCPRRRSIADRVGSKGNSSLAVGVCVAACGGAAAGAGVAAGAGLGNPCIRNWLGSIPGAGLVGTPCPVTGKSNETGRSPSPVGSWSSIE